MANDYLLKEYELSFEQLRFYDTRQESLLKYLCTLTSAVATAEFAIYQLLHGPTKGFFICEAAVSGLVFVATVLLLLAMLHNRLYFVYVARQLNALRGHLMEVASDGFTNNQMYTSTSFPALKLLSVHSFQFFGASIISATFGAGAVYGAIAASGWPWGVALGSVAASAVLVFEVTASVLYLRTKGSKSADEAIHNLENRPPAREAKKLTGI